MRKHAILLLLVTLATGCSKPAPATLRYAARYNRTLPCGEQAGLTGQEWSDKRVAIRQDYAKGLVTEEAADYAIMAIEDRHTLTLARFGK